MPVVGARARDDVDHAAGRAAELGLEARALLTWTSCTKSRDQASWPDVPSVEVGRLDAVDDEPVLGARSTPSIEMPPDCGSWFAPGAWRDDVT